MGDTARKTMTVEEFLLWNLDQENRYELVDGVPVEMLNEVGTPAEMMAGASEYHDQIVINVILALGNQLRGKPCRVATADVAVRTKIRAIRRPDVMVTCSPPRAESYEAQEPRLVVEVLSPSNKGLAWQRKLEEYRHRDGLKYILIIEQGASQATLLTRTGSDWDPIDADDLTAVFDLPDIGCRLAMSDIYDGLTFAAA